MHWRDLVLVSCKITCNFNNTTYIYFQQSELFAQAPWDQVPELIILAYPWMLQIPFPGSCSDNSRKENTSLIVTASIWFTFFICKLIYSPLLPFNFTITSFSDVMARKFSSARFYIVQCYACWLRNEPTISVGLFQGEFVFLVFLHTFPKYLPFAVQS